MWARLILSLFKPFLKIQLKNFQLHPRQPAEENNGEDADIQNACACAGVI